MPPLVHMEAVSEILPGLLRREKMKISNGIANPTPKSARFAYAAVDPGIVCRGKADRQMLNNRNSHVQSPDEIRLPGATRVVCVGGRWNAVYDRLNRRCSQIARQCLTQFLWDAERLPIEFPVMHPGLQQLIRAADEKMRRKRRLGEQKQKQNRPPNALKVSSRHTRS
jgi:hypothetical protein